MYKLTEIKTTDTYRVVTISRVMPDGREAIKVIALGIDRSEQATLLLQAKRDLRQFTDSTWRH